MNVPKISNDALAACAKVLILVVSKSGIPGKNKTDKTATENMVAENGTTSDHAKAVKRLFAKSDRVKRIDKLASAVSQWLASFALPGDVAGRYIVPAARFREIGDRMRQFQAEYLNLIADFADHLAEEIENDRQGKSGLFRAEDYPNSDDIRTAAKFNFHFEPFANAKQFAEIYDNEAIQTELQTCLEASQRALLYRAEETCRGALESAISRAIARVRNYDERTNAGERSRLAAENIITTLQDAASLADDLNFTDCPEIGRLSNGALIACANVMRDCDQENPFDCLKDASTRTGFVSDLSILLSGEQPPEPVTETGETEMAETPETEDSGNLLDLAF